MMRASVFVLIAMAMVSPTSALRSASTTATTDCDGQSRFDIIVCTSHMCGDCAFEWCTETCQEWQLEFPNCKCSTWASGRTSFSGGNFTGKGKSGDVGDFGR